MSTSYGVSVKAIFVVGKGGVGKTTCAAAIALSLSGEHRTLIVSLDPAHNLGDVFGTPLSGKAKELRPGLHALEVDMEQATKDYLKESAGKLKDMYGYLKAINIEGYLDTIRLSPGIEEYATLEEMGKIISEGEGSYEIIVFDTPPTGLTLRVLALPEISLIWGRRLIKLRKEILSRRLAIEKIQGEKKFVLDGKEFELPSRAEKDGVMQELLRYMEEVGRVKKLQTDPERSVVLPVMNPDSLSLFETRRALDTLKSLSMPIGNIVVNKFSGKKEEMEAITRAETELGRPIIKVPLLEEEPVGLPAIESLSGYLRAEEWLPGKRNDA